MEAVKVSKVKIHGKELYAIVEWNNLYELKGDLFGTFEKGDYIGRLQFDMLLPPVLPGTIYGLGINHKEYSAFLPTIGRNASERPVIFAKPTESAVGMSGKLIVPKGHEKSGVKGSGELGIVIKADCENVTPEEASGYILGYMNTYDALPFANYYSTEEEKHKAKGFPTFCPMGPYIVMGIDVSSLMQGTYYNNALILEGSTAGYIWDPCTAISEISKMYPLKKGDVIIMGAMSPTEMIKKKNPKIFTEARLMEGDVVIVETEGLGKLMIEVENAR